MRILRVIASVDPVDGGPIEGLLRSSKALSQLGHETEIATLDDDKSPLFENFQFKVHPFGGLRNTYHYSPSRSPRLVGWLRRNVARFDAVIQHGLWNYTAYATWSALRGENIPYFVFTHGMLDPWFREAYPLKHVAKQAFWLFSEGRLINDARAVLFTTEEERQLAHKAFWPWRARECVVGYGTADVTGDEAIQISTFRQSLPALGSRPFLLFLSRIDPKKGCDILIRSFSKVAMQFPLVDLVIAGPDQIGWRPTLEKMAGAEGIADRIHWCGMIQGDIKWGAYRAAEAFVLPSHSENFGIVVAEALACSAPVIISNKVNIWREVRAGGAGLVCRDDADDFSRALGQFLLMSDEQKNEMRIRARTVFVTHFDIKRSVSRLVEVLKS
jgi:glycosyltransferase involved in cell wall biosynthesis